MPRILTLPLRWLITLTGLGASGAAAARARGLLHGHRMFLQLESPYPKCRWLQSLRIKDIGLCGRLPHKASLLVICLEQAYYILVEVNRYFDRMLGILTLLTPECTLCVCFLIVDHEHSHKKNKRKHWRKQWVDSSILSDVEMLKHSLEVNSFSAGSNKTGTISEKKSHRRTKRFLSYPRFVEVMVVADSRMVAYHGANLQHYVLTLMSIVSMQLRGVGSPLVAKELLSCHVNTISLLQLGVM